MEQWGNARVETVWEEKTFNSVVLMSQSGAKSTIEQIDCAVEYSTDF